MIVGGWYLMQPTILVNKNPEGFCSLAVLGGPRVSTEAYLPFHRILMLVAACCGCLGHARPFTHIRLYQLLGLWLLVRSS